MEKIYESISEYSLGRQSNSDQPIPKNNLYYESVDGEREADNVENDLSQRL